MFVYASAFYDKAVQDNLLMAGRIQDLFLKALHPQKKKGKGISI